MIAICVQWFILAILNMDRSSLFFDQRYVYIEIVSAFLTGKGAWDYKGIYLYVGNVIKNIIECFRWLSPVPVGK